ncbi:hypothetical protein [Ochrobactrum sp. Marseille-Q0166]|uniref:hypothetical protein n=1 Tax=Ochrobactrum sp. Marseille-Q0166 TaxID=2761105 RepID=UPI001655BAB9|nr:hypothetical protein [Ochrobactrum sp. Marseille-Q0166]MBC8719038.1 hypothetical protein [Ochrobactrum sp. Marseille-Q0166]
MKTMSLQSLSDFRRVKVSSHFRTILPKPEYIKKHIDLIRETEPVRINRECLAELERVFAQADFSEVNHA